jgi:hypothetical protein
LYGSSSNCISNATIKTHGFYGIVLSESFDSKSSVNKIVNCEVADCGFAGISITGISTIDLCRQNCVTHCHIHNNAKGVQMIRSKKNYVEQCDIHDNVYGVRVNNIGVKIYEMFKVNHINYNNIYNNEEAGYLGELSYSDAKHNWWGSALGPSFTTIGRKLGMGDKMDFLVGFLSYFPWSIKPYDL